MWQKWMRKISAARTRSLNLSIVDYHQSTPHSRHLAGPASTALRSLFPKWHLQLRCTAVQELFGYSFSLYDIRKRVPEYGDRIIHEKLPHVFSFVSWCIWACLTLPDYKFGNLLGRLNKGLTFRMLCETAFKKGFDDLCSSLHSQCHSLDQWTRLRHSAELRKMTVHWEMRTRVSIRG